ncbi:MAG: response regulator [Phycisphaerales bacterium]|nr:response regulator [Phycisphaerales bacterium]
MPGRFDAIKIVLVDDDKDVLESMNTVFTAEGAITRCAADGNEGVQAVQDEQPDLVVLDMMLPGRSGFLVLEKIKGVEASPGVIMLTANEGKRHQAYAESLGVDRYILKPAPLDQLMRVAEELLIERGRAKAPSKSGS